MGTSGADELRALGGYRPAWPVARRTGGAPGKAVGRAGSGLSAGLGLPAGLSLARGFGLAGSFAVALGLLMSPASVLAQSRPQASGWTATASPEAPAATAEALKGPKPIGPEAATGAGSANGTAGNGIIASSAAVSGTSQRTRVTFAFTRPCNFSIFRLSHPDRIIVADLSEVEFWLPAGTGRQTTGLVKAFRYGLFAPGKSRIVIDTSGPAKVDTARMLAATAKTAAQLEIDLVPASQTDVSASELAAAATVFAVQPEEPPAGKPPERTRPVIVVDAGHGGHRPRRPGCPGRRKGRRAGRRPRSSADAARRQALRRGDDAHHRCLRRARRAGAHLEKRQRRPIPVHPRRIR